jgi:Tol biopolymer transport system component
VQAYQGDFGGTARLEDARTGKVRRVIGRTYTVLGADDRQVVFEPAGCGSDCGLTLADLATGSSRFLPEIGDNAAVAAFSADGHRLAIGYAGLLAEDPSGAPRRDGYVAVVDLNRADQWRMVPGLSTGPASTALPVWSPDGRLLLVVPTDGNGSGRVAAWTPGADRVTLLPAGLTGFYGTPGLAAPLA